MDLAAIGKALTRWLTNATALEARLAEQDGGQPAGDYCTVRVDTRIATDAVPTKAFRVVEGAPAGQEVEVSHGEQPFLAVTVQAYTAASVGNASAMAVLEKARQALVLATVRAQLVTDGGLAVHVRGPVRNLNALAGPRWQGRAALELQVNVVQVVTERVTFIETAAASVVEGG